ncbi:hypothetical protein [Ruegeria sp. HKCCA4633]|uniref:hypothetical protein n=1 Tax=Ruegeria sp. HKCCA4633 TaxID=2682983 RepID=UPI001489FDA6|nr:hypothetical protein [Ruegeria sp. HKCCA4633]
MTIRRRRDTSQNPGPSIHVGVEYRKNKDPSLIVTDPRTGKAHRIALKEDGPEVRGPCLNNPVTFRNMEIPI